MIKLRVKDPSTGRFLVKKRPWNTFMRNHSCVTGWLENRPLGTQEKYAAALQSFCDASSISPEAFLTLSRFEARDVAWTFVKPSIRPSPSTARIRLAALKSFYRSNDGESLPFDSRRGGKHYFNARRRKKAAIEYVPTKTEMYKIIDSAYTLRDKAMLMMLFQSGVRVNVLFHLRFGDVSNQLYPKVTIPLRLRITDELDTKLQGYVINFYDTFLQGEAVETLKAYCDKYHPRQDTSKPLFYTQLGKPVYESAVWSMVKRCVRRAGLDPSTIWIHTIRRAFKRIVRHAPIDDADFSEAIMGHVLPNARENYFSRNHTTEIANEYMKVDFSRDIPESRAQLQAEQIRVVQHENKVLKEKLDQLTQNGTDKITALETLLKRVELLERKLEENT